jgi:hypothetical protein
MGIFISDGDCYVDPDVSIRINRLVVEVVLGPGHPRICGRKNSQKGYNYYYIY